MLNNRLFLLSTTVPGERLFALNQPRVRSIKTALTVESSRESPDDSNKWQFSQNEALKELNIDGCQTAGFHHDTRLLIFKSTAELKRGKWESSKLKCHKRTDFFFLTEIRPFFLNKPSLNGCKLLATFLSSEIVNSDHVSSVHIGFMEETFSDPGPAFFLDIWFLTLDQFMMC